MKKRFCKRVRNCQGTAPPVFAIVLAVFFAWGAGGLFAAGTIDQGIEKQVKYIIKQAPPGGKVAIVSVNVSVSGPSAEDKAHLAEYIMEKMPDYGINNRKNVEFFDRSNLDAVQAEINFQYSGDVSDNTMVQIGNAIGAQIIISGRVMEKGSNYEFNVKLIDVETRKTLGSNTVKIKHDEDMATFLSGSHVDRNLQAKERERARQNREIQEKTKDALGIFSNGGYIGYLGSLKTPIGFSFGALRTKVGLFWDNAFGFPIFGDYDPTDKTGSELEALKYNGTGEYTGMYWNSLLGLNIRIVPAVLWLNAGAGIQYNFQRYEVYEKDNEKRWADVNGEELIDHIRALVSAGLLIKIWYIYGQIKYIYAIPEPFNMANYGMDQLFIGVGYVWRNKNLPR